MLCASYAWTRRQSRRQTLIVSVAPQCNELMILFHQLWIYFELFCFVELTQIEVVQFQPMNFNKLFQMVIKNVSKGYNEQQLPSSK